MSGKTLDLKAIIESTKDNPPSTKEKPFKDVNEVVNKNPNRRKNLMSRDEN